jgi:hypothetical protein
MIPLQHLRNDKIFTNGEQDSDRHGSGEGGWSVGVALKGHQEEPCAHRMFCDMNVSMSMSWF